ncbi:winged helix-turn-helix domain-containing protein, partial [Nocardioides kribbensis]|uniref:winged helix-turn-helix domain-containing protein n=1 Tax=Nocardioides kribbensis TaxID=305517 RepID=UPI0032DACA90
MTQATSVRSAAHSATGARRPDPGPLPLSATTVSASRLAALVGGFDRSPAYLGLADALTLLIGDGRIGYGTRLPSERDLTEALAVSRTTVTRAYAALRETGFAEARQGAGTFALLPGGR